MERNKHIPLKNLYYMLAYACGALHLAAWRKAGTERFAHLQDLFALLFAEGIGWQLKQGIPRNYVPQREDLQGLRGQLYIPGVLRNRAARRLRLTCDYDEFSENNLANRIIRSAAELLLRADGVKEEYRRRLREELLYFSGVGTADLRSVPWSRLTFSRNGGNQEFLVRLAELLTKGFLMTEENGAVRIRDSLDDREMSRIYEKFLLGYYQYHFPRLRPQARQISWAVEGNAAYLPLMQSDILMGRGGRELILDAKCYTRALQEHHGTYTQRSDNLYQLFTYVKNREALSPAGTTVSGMLLYARTDEAVQPDQTYCIAGNRFDVRTLDLSRDFSQIDAALKGIGEEFFSE